MIYFIVGTDTEIGKTFVTSKILANDLANGSNSFAYKPVETGKILFENFIGSDSYKYAEMLHRDINTVNSYFLTKPCSPHLAADLDDVTIDIELIYNKINELNSHYENIYVEGAGGLLVPYNEEITFLDLIIKFRDVAKVIIVSKNCLGTINHTLLTVNMLKYSNINIDRIIFNNLNKGEDSLIMKDNISIVKTLSGINNIEVMNYEE